MSWAVATGVIQGIVRTTSPGQEGQDREEEEGEEADDLEDETEPQFARHINVDSSRDARPRGVPGGAQRPGSEGWSRESWACGLGES